MGSKAAKLNHRRTQALLRYKKHRQRNLLAEPGVHDFVIILDHLKGSYNVPKIFRSAQAFGAQAVHLVNVPEFDPAPAKGAFKYVPAKFHKDFDSCYQSLSAEGYQFFTLEPGIDNDLASADLPKKSAFVFGNEELGISFNTSDYPDIKTLSIKHYGRIDSLNVSVAASIVMYQYTTLHPVDSTEEKAT
jgi:tRNA G18 (ribose-2'-O)-methylase SpoU